MIKENGLPFKPTNDTLATDLKQALKEVKNGETTTKYTTSLADVPEKDKKSYDGSGFRKPALWISLAMAVLLVTGVLVFLIMKVRENKNLFNK